LKYNIIYFICVFTFFNTHAKAQEDQNLSETLERIIKISGAFLDNTPFHQPLLGGQILGTSFLFSFLPSLENKDLKNSTPNFHAIPVFYYETSYSLFSSTSFYTRTTLGLSIPGSEKIVGIKEKPSQWLLGAMGSFHYEANPFLFWVTTGFQFSKSTIKGVESTLEGIPEPMESIVDSQTSLFSVALGVLWNHSLFSFIKPYTSLAIHSKHTQTSIEIQGETKFTPSQEDDLQDTPFPFSTSFEIGGYLFEDKMFIAFQELFIFERLYMPRIMIGTRWVLDPHPN